MNGIFKIVINCTFLNKKAYDIFSILQCMLYEVRLCYS